MNGPAWERVPVDNPGAFAVWLRLRIEEALLQVRLDLEADHPDLSSATIEGLVASARPKVEAAAWERWLPYLSMVPH